MKPLGEITQRRRLGRVRLLDSFPRLIPNFLHLPLRRLTSLALVDRLLHPEGEWAFRLNASTYAFSLLGMPFSQLCLSKSFSPSDVQTTRYLLQGHRQSLLTSLEFGWYHSCGTQRLPCMIIMGLIYLTSSARW